MADNQEKIKEYFAAKKDELATKIEKTPMERFFLIFLVLITVSAVVLSYLQFKQNLEGPFFSTYLDLKRSGFQEKYKVITNVNSPAQAAELQNKDSDLDGLSDYEEIYVYHTNPYLEDTDSDGTWDKQEILAGADPNCPTGQDCSAVTQSTEPANTNSAATGSTNLNQDLTGLNINLPANLNFSVDNLSQIQDLLLSGQMNLTDLGIDSPELQQMLDQLKTQPANTNTPATQDTQKLMESLKNMTPEQLRQELVSKGMDKATLDKIDDATLRQIFLDTLNTYQ